MKATTKDHQAFQCARAVIESLQRSTQRFIDEHQMKTDAGEPCKASDWQFWSTVEINGKSQGLSYYRIQRLVDIGWVEQRPSNGHGPELRIKGSTL